MHWTWLLLYQVGLFLLANFHTIIITTIAITIPSITTSPHKMLALWGIDTSAWLHTPHHSFLPSSGLHLQASLSGGGTGGSRTHTIENQQSLGLRRLPFPPLSLAEAVGFEPTDLSAGTFQEYCSTNWATLPTKPNCEHYNTLRLVCQLQVARSQP